MAIGRQEERLNEAQGQELVSELNIALDRAWQ